GDGVRWLVSRWRLHVVSEAVKIVETVKIVPGKTAAVVAVGEGQLQGAEVGHGHVSDRNVAVDPVSAAPPGRLAVGAATSSAQRGAGEAGNPAIFPQQLQSATAVEQTYFLR